MMVFFFSKHHRRFGLRRSQSLSLSLLFSLVRIEGIGSAVRSGREGSSRRLR